MSELINIIFCFCVIQVLCLKTIHIKLPFYPSQMTKAY